MRKIKIPNMKSTSFKANALLNQLLDLLNNLPIGTESRNAVLIQVVEIIEEYIEDSVEDAK